MNHYIQSASGRPQLVLINVFKVILVGYGKTDPNHKMSTGQTLAQMYLTCTWLEAILYGINCMLFGGCVYVLSSRESAAHRVLLLASSFQFALATAHVILTFVQAMIAFTSPMIIATTNGASSYYEDGGGNRVYIASMSVYVINAYAQELLLIWRLFIVWNRNWKICILPFMIWIAHCTIASLAIVFVAPKNADVFSHNVQVFALAGWSLEMIINLTVTGGIAYHLWRSGRQTAVLTRHFSYRNTILTIVESGVLITSCTCVMFGLFVSGNIAGTVAVNIATQIGTMTPLLIIVRVGLGLSRSKLGPSSSGGRSFTAYSRPTEVNVVRSQTTTSDFPLHVLPKSKGVLSDYE
ncbi:hypothetical protein DFH29DRAFT_851737 [Suillus ampliporus]|nr:hypothetical protein DFH29DRAFT_851737 [Suillus ampliporus]